MRFNWLITSSSISVSVLLFSSLFSRFIDPHRLCRVLNVWLGMYMSVNPSCDSSCSSWEELFKLFGCVYLLMYSMKYFRAEKHPLLLLFFRKCLNPLKTRTWHSAPSWCAGWGRRGISVDERSRLWCFCHQRRWGVSVHHWRSSHCALFPYALETLLIPLSWTEKSHIISIRLPTKHIFLVFHL